jgi:hypothetical protein
MLYARSHRNYYHGNDLWIGKHKQRRQAFITVHTSLITVKHSLEVPFKLYGAHNRSFASRMELLMKIKMFATLKIFITVLYEGKNNSSSVLSWAINGQRDKLKEKTYYRNFK